jgi:transposase
MAKTFRPYEPAQSFLLPPSPLDWLPESHLARFILDVVAQLDLSAILDTYERDLRGFPPHNPRMMVALLLYAYCVGVPSSRKIERRTHEDVAFRVLAGNTHPDHTAISEFRRRHLDALAGLFVQVLQLCQAMGLVKLGNVSLDGTKLKGNASKHKAMSYKRMLEEEKRLREKILALLAAAQQADTEEDVKHGPGQRGDELPDELRRAETRLARIQAAREALEREARERQEQDASQAEGGGSDNKSGDGQTGGGCVDDLPRNRPATQKDGTPTDKAQRNFTDPESRIMKTNDGFIQGYNGQAVVDEANQIIIAHGLGNQSPDPQYFEPMLARAISNTGAAPAVITADSGYFSEQNIEAALAQDVAPLIAPGRERHGSEAFKPEKPKSPTLRDTMRECLNELGGLALYKRRKVIVEPVFGQIKNRGFRALLLRGIVKARGEWALITLTHNLLKLHRAQPAT